MQTATVALNQGYKPREPRQKVVVSARMRIDGKYSDVCIRDISSRGMMLQAATPPRPGTYIEIYRATHIIVARVVWARERRFGILAQDRMNVPAIINAAAVSGPRNADEERRSERRPRTPCGPADLAQQAELSRRRSRAFEFGLLVACGVIGAGFFASLTFNTLASPFRHASSHLVIGK